MLFIKILCSALIISLVESLPTNENKRTRRPSLETYKYNHPPSIAIPVSVVFENDKSTSDKSGKDVEKSEDTKPEHLRELSSDIPVSVVLDRNVSGSDKSKSPEKVNSVRSDNQSLQSEKLTPIPVSVVIQKEVQPSERKGKFEKQSSEVDNKFLTSINKSAVAIPVAVVIQLEGKQNQVVIKPEKVSTDGVNSKVLPKEIQTDEKDAEPAILISTKSIKSNNDIEITTRSSIQISEPKQKGEELKNYFKPQLRNFHLQYQIPVAVVYDEPIEITNKKIKSYREQLRMRKTRRRRPNSTSEPTTIEVTTVEDITTVREQLSQNEVKQDVIGKQRLKKTQDNEKRPEATQVTENKTKISQTKPSQEKPNISRGEAKKNVRGRQRFKQIQNTYVPSVNIPVVVKFTENKDEELKSKDTQDKPATSQKGVKQNVRSGQRVKQTQDTSSLSIPVVVTFTENKEQEPQTMFTQDKLSTGTNEVKQNVRSQKRNKQTQDKSIVEKNIPVVVQFTENKNNSIQRSQNNPYTSKTVVKQDAPSVIENIPVILQFTENKVVKSSHAQDKASITKPANQDDFSSEEIIANREQPKSSLQTQNRNSSFEAQQKEEKRQDSDNANKRERDPVVPIVKSDNHAYGNSGSFSYSYESGDGTKAFETGELKKFEDDKTGAAVVGGFSYKDKDGTDYSLSYTADENGYRPVGDHLPTPPPIPVAIQRALDYLATKTTPASVTEAGEA